ncbi:MAG: hypothetical protein U5L09_12630 [Bacteroidales bacterium]|nr:hypothetical protein [Bacteroidales bacterium]
MDYVEYTNLNAGFPSGDLAISENPSGENGVVQINIEHTPFTGFAWPDGKMFDLKFTFAGGNADFQITTAEFVPTLWIKMLPLSKEVLKAMQILLLMVTGNTARNMDR